MKKIYPIGAVIALIATSYYIHKKNSETNPTKVFTKIYDKALWGGGSGPGSAPENASHYLRLLQEMFNSIKYSNVHDLGCGDWRLMSTIKIPENVTYYGYDVVKPVVDANLKSHSKKNIRFIHINGLKDLYKVKGELLIVKDVMQHWPNVDIEYFITKILPNFKYPLITNDFDKNAKNEDIKLGGWRQLNLEKEPYNLKNVTVLIDYPAHSLVKRVYLYTNPNM